MTDIYLSIAVIVVVLASVYWFWFKDTYPISWLNIINEDEIDDDTQVERFDTVNEPYLDDEDIRFLKQMEGDIAETESDDF